jgi:hypothetical protein
MASDDLTELNDIHSVDIARLKETQKTEADSLLNQHQIVKNAQEGQISSLKHRVEIAEGKLTRPYVTLNFVESEPGTEQTDLFATCENRSAFSVFLSSSVLGTAVQQEIWGGPKAKGYKTEFCIKSSEFFDLRITESRRLPYLILYDDKLRGQRDKVVSLQYGRFLKELLDQILVIQSVPDLRIPLNLKYSDADGNEYTTEQALYYHPGIRGTPRMEEPRQIGSAPSKT